MASNANSDSPTNLHWLLNNAAESVQATAIRTDLPTQHLRRIPISSISTRSADS